jgi:hypothetical protein
MLFFLTFIFLISKIFNLTCGEENIEYCLECGEEDTCAKCDDKHFLFLSNYLCLPCDDLSFGHSGCKANCYIDNNNLFCKECEDGFYNFDDICRNCNSENTLNCGKCSYDTEFKCYECINNEYKLNSSGICEHCDLPKCIQCHYPEKNSTKAVCDKCEYNYYISSGTCVQCKKKDIKGGYCYYCTDNSTDYDNIECYCYSSYYPKSGKCNSCPNNCNYCVFDDNLNKTICKSCNIGYILNEDKCINCGKGCNFCYLDQKKIQFVLFVLLDIKKKMENVLNVQKIVINVI